MVTGRSACRVPRMPMLRPAHAVAALLQLSDGRYVMQLRDSNPNIFYPDHWGCFGGAVDPGEAPAVALVRELREEHADPGGCDAFHRIHL
jgi:8-oxo-dGTP pyrophosphatase MutT (NUDIX family)